MTKHVPQSRSLYVRRLIWPAAALFGGGLVLSGCPSGAELENVEEHLQAGAACDALPIFEVNCAGGICHGSEDGSPPSGGVDLLAPGVGSRLLNVPATYPDVSGCPETPELLIDSSNLEASLMWTKLNNTQQCGDGMPVPHSVSALGEADMNCVRSWMQSLIDGGGSGSGGGTGMGGAAAPGSGGSTSGSGGAMAGTGGTSATGGVGNPATEVRVEAECALGQGACAGVTASYTGGAMLEEGNMQVGYLGDGVTLTYGGIETAGFDTITLQYAKGAPDGTFEVHLGSAGGDLLASFDPTETGAWDTYVPMELELSQTLTGAQTIVFVPVGSTGVLNLDWFELSAGSAQ